jgi:hypothetical protein
MISNDTIFGIVLVLIDKVFYFNVMEFNFHSI